MRITVTRVLHYVANEFEVSSGFLSDCEWVSHNQHGTDGRTDGVQTLCRSDVLTITDTKRRIYVF